jgi:hypothetical protein
MNAMLTTLLPGQGWVGPRHGYRPGDERRCRHRGAIGLVEATTLRATRVYGTVCFTGMLSNEWTVRLLPIDYLPQGVRLTAYSGEAGNLPAGQLQA